MAIKILKNIHLLADEVSEDKRILMEDAALLHMRYSNIAFKIVDLLPGKVIIQAVQGKSPSGHQFPQKRLIEIVHETFDDFFPKKKINVHAVPYTVPACDVVNADWINGQMLKYGIKAKDISDDTGIDRTQITALLSKENARNLSQPMKAMLWYYFELKKLGQKPK